MPRGSAKPCFIPFHDRPNGQGCPGGQHQHALCITCKRPHHPHWDLGELVQRMRSTGPPVIGPPSAPPFTLVVASTEPNCTHSADPLPASVPTIRLLSLFPPFSFPPVSQITSSIVARRSRTSNPHSGGRVSERETNGTRGTLRSTYGWYE